MKNNVYSTRYVEKNVNGLQVTHHNVNLNLPRYINYLHWHNFFEIEMIDDGYAEHIINGVSTVVGARSIYLLTPTDLHTLRPLPDSNMTKISRYSFIFRSEILSEDIFLELMSLTQPISVQIPEAEFPEYCYFADAICELQKNNTEYAHQMQQHLFIYLLLRFLEKFSGQTESRYKKTDNTDREYTNRAIAYIRYNFQNQSLTLNDIANEFYLSPNYFGTVFRQTAQISCRQFIKKTRLEFSLSLLRNTALSVSEIAEKSGYTNASYFISDFRGQYGITPQKFRLSLDIKPGDSPTI